jgi:hypothetical protein
MQKNPVEEQIRCDALGEMISDMVDNGEHGLTASDILLSFINNVMLQEERDMILSGIKREE